MTVKNKKVYDFNAERVKKQLVTAFKKKKRESTIADLISVTGLPKYQVEQTVKHVLDEYSGHMKVTESGEILYYFPNGMKSKYRGFGPRMKRFLHSALNITGKVLSFLFKIWIMVMVVGYFILFLLLLVLAVVAAFAGAAAGNKDGDGPGGGGRGGRPGMGGFGLFFLPIRIIEMFFYILIFSEPRKKRPVRKEKKRPLHRSVFAYAFGDVNPNEGWEEDQKKQIVQYIQSHKGLITLEEFIVLTGFSYDSAQDTINGYLVEFEGEPKVTEEGSLYYFFPELLKTHTETETIPLKPRYKQIIPFNSNKKAMNGWITFFNTFNLGFGSYFLYFGSLSYATAQTVGASYLYLVTRSLFTSIGLGSGVIPFALGTVPVSFSVLFFLVPLLRRWREKSKNEKIKQENYRKRLYSELLRYPVKFDPEDITPLQKQEAPASWQTFRDTEINRIGVEKQIEIEQTESGKQLYTFPELKRELIDIENYRKQLDISEYKKLGETIFDSGE